jgi:hypothetical protein
MWLSTFSRTSTPSVPAVARSERFCQHHTSVIGRGKGTNDAQSYEGKDRSSVSSARRRTRLAVSTWARCEKSSCGLDDENEDQSRNKSMDVSRRVRTVGSRPSA